MGKDNQFDLLLRRSRRLSVGECQVDLALNEVHGPSGTVRLAPKAAAVLEVLLYTAGQPVSKERLLVEVWRGEYPTDDVVTHAIGELRRAFGDDARQPRYIRTLARVGYALIAEVGPLEDPAPAGAARPPDPLPPCPPAAASTAESQLSTEPGTAQPQQSGPGEPARVAAVAAGQAPLPRRVRWPVAAPLALLVLAIAALGWHLGRGDGESPPARVATVPAERPARPQVEPATWLPGAEQFPSLSPDGSLLAFSADPEGLGIPRVHVQVMGAGNPRVLSSVTVEREHYPVFSPDGRELALQRVADGRCVIVVASVLGGAEREVGACTSDLVRHMTWTPDGAALVIQTMEPGAPARAVLYRVDLASGKVEPLQYPTSPTESDVQARYSPDGQWLALRRGPIPHSDLYIMRPDGTALRRVTTLRSEMPGFDWMPDGKSLVFSSGHLGNIALYRVDVATGTITPLGIEHAIWPDMASLRDELVFVAGGAPTEVVEVALDGALDAQPRSIAATSRSNAEGAYSHDGQRIALASDRSGQWSVHVVDGAESRQVFTPDQGMVLDPRWSPGDSHLLTVVRGNGSRLFEVEVASGRARDLTPAGHRVMSAAYSPDGRGIAFTSDSSGQWEVWWMDLPDGGGLKQLTQGGARHPAFREAGQLVHIGGTEVGRLQQLDLVSGEITDLALQANYWNQRGWYPATDALYAVRQEQPGVYRRSWDGGEWQLVEPIGELPLAEVRLSLDPRQQRALLTTKPGGQGDISRVRGMMASLNASPDPQ